MGAAMGLYRPAVPAACVAVPLLLPVLVAMLLMWAVPVRADGDGIEVILAGTLPNGLRARLLSLSALSGDDGEPVVSRSALSLRAEGDRDMFVRFLRSEGYYRARVSVQAGIGQHPGQVVFTVDSGPVYRIADVTLAYDGAVDATVDATVQDRVLDGLGLAAGMPVRAGDIVAAEARVPRVLMRNGFPQARMGVRDVVVDHATETASVRLRVEPGAAVTLGRPRYDGLVSVRASYLDRLTPWRDGEIYDQDKVDLFERRLSRTGLFRLVAVSMEPQADGPPVLLARLEETRHRSLSLSAGFATSEGIGGDVVWEHSNWRGRGETLTLTARGAEIRQSVTAALRLPHFQRFGQTFFTTVSLNRDDTDAFTAEGVELRAGLERPIGRDLTGAVALEVDINDIRDSESDQSFELLALPLSVMWDTADDLLNPETGWRLGVKATPFIARDTDSTTFYRAQMTASAYYTPADCLPLTVALRARVGATYGAETNEIPANRRFFGGGGGSIRGFNFQEVGPVSDDGTPRGGRSILEVGAELRWRLSDTVGVVPFVEGGNVYDTASPRLSGFRWGAGLGLRYYTSFGPLRFDIATPLDPAGGDPAVQVYIGIGQAF